MNKQYISIILCLFSVKLYSVKSAKLVYKNDISISSGNLQSDLERISADTMTDLDLNVDDTKFERLRSVVSIHNKDSEEYHSAKFKKYDYPIDYGNLHDKHNQSRKRLADAKSDYDSRTVKEFINGSFEEYDYNFEEFKKEYDSVTIEPAPIQTVKSHSNISDNALPDDRPFEMNYVKEYSTQCIEMALWKYLFFGIPCVLHEAKHITGDGKILNLLKMFYKTVLVLATAGLTFLAALWCYNGKGDKVIFALCCILCPGTESCLN